MARDPARALKLAKKLRQKPAQNLAQKTALKPLLDDLYENFNVADAAEDPVQFLSRYDDTADREIVAFCAASLAFVRVASVKASIARVLETMGPHPAAYVRSFHVEHHAAALQTFVHRWTRGADIVALMLMMQHMLRETGSIENFFADGLPADATDVETALESFSQRACAIDVRAAYGRRRLPARAGVRFFFPRPSTGSGCKRLNLFLRWMVRRDQVDPGGWHRVTPAQLIVPLDTHVIRVGRCLRLTSYQSPGWRMASDITRTLREIDPADPIKYDFSLCHLGMMNACGFNRPQRDRVCPLRGYCRPTARRPRASRAPSAPR
jgi:uncharacterized protein (TIGR02757 family)